MSLPDNAYINALLLINGLGSKTILNLLEKFDSPEHLWQASRKELETKNIPPSYIDALCEHRGKIDIAKAYHVYEKENIQLVNVFDNDYPPLLKHIYNPPILLYFKGDIGLAHKNCLAVVGTRKITDYGRRTLENIIPPVVEQDMTVVSGLAFGTDLRAHQETLKHGGHTIAVLAGCVDTITPRANYHTGKKIIEEGLLLSEQPYGTKIEKHHFPIRNRLIAGLSQATVVIEAGKRSGSLITAYQAMENGRDVFALPGSIESPTSKGCNNIIAKGAIPLLNAKQLLKDLGYDPDSHLQTPKEPYNPQNKIESALLKILGTEKTHVESIFEALDFDKKDIQATLSFLEIEGVIRDAGSKWYIKM